METLYAVTITIALALGLMALGWSSLILPLSPVRHMPVRDRQAHRTSAAARDMLTGRDPYGV
jgi:hypothetical protein